MDLGFSTPLVDFFRRREVARDVRLLAAKGALAPRAHEQLTLLTLLVDDPDEEIKSTAEATLSAIPVGSIAAFLARADASAELRAFFAARGIEPAAVADGTADEPLIDTGGGEAPADESADVNEEQRASIAQQLAQMSVPQRVERALKGRREERSILIRDQNKLVAMSVLSSPRITEIEIESIARMANVSDEILRVIASTRAWVKNYRVALALARNPKTPVALSMNLLPRLSERDLKLISTDRNVPDVIRLTARKKVVIG